jgi:hypothetical protein
MTMFPIMMFRNMAPSDDPSYRRTGILPVAVALSRCFLPLTGQAGIPFRLDRHSFLLF